MTYCLGIVTKHGLVMASDSRTNAGYDQVNVCRKMHTFVQPGERVFIVLTSGSLSCAQSVITLLQAEFQLGEGLAKAPSMYDAARVIGAQIRRVADMDRAAARNATISNSTCNFSWAGRSKDSLPISTSSTRRATRCGPQRIRLIFRSASANTVGRSSTAASSLSRTTLEEAARYAVISLDSTMRANVTVGPPIDLVMYATDSLEITQQRASPDRDPDLLRNHAQWEHALRKAVGELPAIEFGPRDKPTT